MHYLRVVYTLQKNDQKEKKALKDEGKTLKPTRIAHLKTYNRISFQGHRFYFWNTFQSHRYWCNLWHPKHLASACVHSSTYLFYLNRWIMNLFVGLEITQKTIFHVIILHNIKVGNHSLTISEMMLGENHRLWLDDVSKKYLGTFCLHSYNHGHAE